MSGFRKFNSIKEVVLQKYLDRVYREGYGDEVFVVLEKYHGANFGVIVDDQGVRCQSRELLLEEDASFYDYEHILERDREKFKQVFDFFKSSFQGVNSIILYGELVGGVYDHPEYNKKIRDNIIQHEVHYAPDTDCVFFDIFIRGDREHYLNHLDVVTMINSYELKYSEVLFEGSLKDCLEFSAKTNGDPSLGFKKWGLPEIADNIREGNVIKPLKSLFFKDGRRIIFKDKNDKFRETLARKKPDLGATERSKEARELIKDFVTEARLKSVLSKHSRFSQKDFGKLMGLYMKDVIEDFRDHYPDVFSDTSKKERSSITKHATGLAQRLIMSSFAKIVDGTY